MAFIPRSTVYLLDTPLDNTNKNQLSFTNADAQWEYFQSRIKHRYEQITYQRKDNRIRVRTSIDELWNANYVMYMNANFTGKWFYAFITKMEYVSEEVTDIFIETDVYQTWLFDATLKQSFVMREHVKDDTIGLHTVDEQLETGEYLSSEYTMINQLGANWNILAVSDNTPLGDTEKIGNLYGEVMTGLSYYPFPNNSVGVQWLKDTIELYDEAGKPDAISMIFTVPYLSIESTVNKTGWNLGDPIESGAEYGFVNFSVTTKPTNLDGYVPKNNKLFTNPYCMLYMTNSVGNSATYDYEFFNNDDIRFYLLATPSPNPTVILVPMYYRNSSENYEYSLSLQGYPLGSWNSDTYTAWFAQNSASTGIALLGSAGAVVGGIASLNPMIAVGGALGVASQLAQLSKAKIQPDQAKGQTGNGNAMFSMSKLGFYYSKLNIKREFAKRIDDYFSMYGYKVNTLKIPETRSRSSWNYIQTIDVNITGTLPMEDMVKLKKIYNEGVTLWHDWRGFLNYNQSNEII